MSNIDSHLRQWAKNQGFRITLFQTDLMLFFSLIGLEKWDRFQFLENTIKSRSGSPSILGIEVYKNELLGKFDRI